MAAPKENKFSLGNTWGRPPIYEHPEDLAKKILEYFDYCEGEFEEKEVEELDKKTLKPTGKKIKVKDYIRYPEHKTITGLCLYVGFEARSTFDRYAERSDDFSYIVKRAKMVIENRYEGRLSSDIPGSSTGAIFALKNMGWKDQHQVENTGEMTMTWNEIKTYEAEPETDPGA